jgi:hypothetical protein
LSKRKLEEEKVEEEEEEVELVVVEAFLYSWVVTVPVAIYLAKIKMLECDHVYNNNNSLTLKAAAVVAVEVVQ